MSTKKSKFMAVLSVKLGLTLNIIAVQRLSPNVHFTSTLNGNYAYSNLVVLILPSKYLRDHNHTLQEKYETRTLSYQSRTLPSLCGENLLISLKTIYVLHQRNDHILFRGARTDRAAVTLLKY